MESDKESVSAAMNEVAAARILYEKHTAKRLAATMDVPLGTARDWLYERMSSARRRELVEAMIVECRARKETFSALERWLLRRASEL